MDRRTILKSCLGAAAGSLGAEMTAQAQSGTGSQVGSGWRCGAFSNNEAFARGAAQAFTSNGQLVGMEHAFTYPGNARNYMILDKDAAFLEQANIVAIYGHGNTDGPSLEYVPEPLRPLGLPYWKLPYSWGEDGAAQWVFIGGCEALGFATLPDGSIYRDGWVSPMRWQQAFQGISGICGFRSLSYYWADSQGGAAGLGAQYGATLVAALASGATMWDSWRAATSWLHTVLNHQVDIACYVSDARNYGDTLSDYALDRVRNFDATLVRHAIVGRGNHPCYGQYCHTVDAAGWPTCSPDPVCEQSLSVIYEASDTIGKLTLPVARFESQADSASKLFGERATVLRAKSARLGRDTTLFTHASTTTSVESQRLSQIDAIGANSGISIRHSLNPTDGVGSADSPLLVYARSVVIGDLKYPICLDGGVQVLSGPNKSMVIADSGYGSLTITGQRRLPAVSTAIAALQRNAPANSEISARRVTPVYLRRQIRDEGQLFPALQVMYDRRTNGGPLLREIVFL